MVSSAIETSYKTLLGDPNAALHAKAVVERQRGLIVTLRKLKLSAKEAEDMLLLFLGTLCCFEHHAQDIRMALDATKSAKGGSQPEKRFKH